MEGFRPASRVTLRDTGELEDSMAGQSDGQSAGEYIVGWGAMVRRPLLSYAPVAAFSRSTRIVCWQVKLTNARLSKLPARGKLTVSDIECSRCRPSAASHMKTSCGGARRTTLPPTRA